MLAAESYQANGLLLLAYPLHPAGQPAKLRDGHLPSIRMPAICFNGTRDPFCSKSIMDEVLTRVGANWRMEWIEGADHSFHVLKSSGRTDADVMKEIGISAASWVKDL
jgi:predicted alpha/beta-hydrolase family hydrolase